jgi:hypothetical protein
VSLDIEGPRRTGKFATLRPYARPPAEGLKRYLQWLWLPGLAGFCLLYGFGFALTAPYLMVPFATPIGLLAVLAIWSLPDARTAPVRSTEALFFAFFICLAVWPNYLAIALPGLPWITMVRLTGIPMALALLICLSTSRQFRADLLDRISSVPLLWKALSVFVAIQFITIALSKQPSASLSKFIVQQVNWTAIFFISCYIFSKPGRPMRWALLFWFTAVWISALGVWEARLQQVLWSGHVPSFLRVEDAANILRGSVRSATGEYRVKTTFSTALGMAEFIALALPFVLHFALSHRALLVRIVAGATVPLLIYVVLETQSRLGMVGSIMSLALYFAFWAMIRWRRNPEDLFGPLIVFATPFVLGAVLAATFLVRRLRTKVWGTGATQASDASRDAQIEMGLPLIMRNPIGHGPGQAAEVLQFRGGGGILTIDNYWLSIGLEYGVIGFIAFYGMIALGIIFSALYALRYARQGSAEFDLFIPISVSLANFIVIKLVFSQPDNHPLIFMLLGLVVALVFKAKQGNAPERLAPAKQRSSRSAQPNSHLT